MLKIKGFSLACAGLALLLPALWTPAASAADEAALRAKLRAAIPDMEVTRIRESKIPGVFEVMFGTEVLYVSGDGRYLIQGDLLDLSERRNLSEETRSVARVTLLDKIPPEETIEFAPPRVEHTVYVFTDVSCGFCRRLHRDMPQLNRLGIAVRYLAFPRNGEDSQAFHDMESVWCAADRKTAITEAKLGHGVKEASCRNPVEKQYLLGQSLGVRGTPAIFRADGRLLSGYMPPEELLEALEER
jgi:thiol:disulfide interchange protein DsbC